MEIVLVKQKSLRTAPINLADCDRYLFCHEFEANYSEPFYSVLKNCRLTNDLVVIKNFKFISDDRLFNEIFSIRSTKRKLKLIFRALFKNQKTSLKCGILAIDNWSKGYFHWMTDVLPKLIALPENHKGLPLFLPKQYKQSSFIEGSLAVLGISNIYYLKSNETVKVNELVVPGIMAVTGNYNDELMRTLRTKVLEHFNVSEKPSLKLFVVRDKKLPRAIVNFDEIKKVVVKYGIQLVVFETLTWTEQVLLASKCKFLIGLHGAGLTNMLFMREGNSVLELRAKDDSLNNCYFSLASAMQLNYAYQLCQGKDADKSTQENDFFVDSNLLEANIRAILKQAEVA